ncbi:AfsR/SARP family transcriptional regulator [Nocardia transvalensis]|uniref:AfsR/SARP family transcriptional regulator n=1 Tax=Nocardia transvalensis TaxID=37333 RepID=UPI001892D573|nr:BTAD domain-containing putative transcriptional regulator [Nocardia transvalensis]MBF6329907.1 tetratricopeptide repeat protein [Nocardia transvalensis]
MLAERQIRYGVLGPVTASRDEQTIDLGQARQQAVFVTLLLEMNRPLSVNSIIDAVWGEHRPGDARNAIQTYISRLRRALALGREPDEPGPALLWTERGYVLRGDPSLLDCVVFERHMATAELCRRHGDYGAAAEKIEAALELWRGEPFTGLDGPFIEAERRRWSERYLSALECRAATKIDLHRYADAVAELTQLVAAHPLQERFRALLMFALYRCGRRAEALEVFQDIRRRLTEELGIEPGPELRKLQQQILRGEFEQSEYTHPEVLVSRNQLPGDIADFTGRKDEMARLMAAIPRDTAPATVLVEAVDGMAGVGKTTLAVHAAHQLSSRYPDAQLYIDLHGHAAEQEPTEPAAALDTLLRAIGVPGEVIPGDLDARAALWRSKLAVRSALIVLDNAADADQVRPLLPGTPTCFVLVTSRRRLIDLEGCRTLSLGVLPLEDAVGLFATIVGDDRVAAEPEAVEEIVRLCGRLPLAIRIAAGRLRARPAWRVGELAQRLRQPRRRLDHLSAGSRSVTAALTVGYKDLPVDQQRVFRLLGLHPGPDFDAYATAALADIDVDVAEQILEALVDVHLLEQVVSGRYSFHDLVRDFAATLTRPSDPGRAAALTRLFDHYRYAAWTASTTLFPDDSVRSLDPLEPTTPIPALTDPHDCMAWLHSERPNLLAVAKYAARVCWPGYTKQFSEILWQFLTGLQCSDDAIKLHSDAIEVARRTGEQEQECRLLTNLGFTLWRTRHGRQALSVLNEAVQLAHARGDRAAEIRAMHHCGLVYFRLGRYRDALISYHGALLLSRIGGDRFFEGHALNGLGLVYKVMGYHEEALSCLRRALRVADDTTNLYLRASALIRAGETRLRTGRYEQALVHLEDARETLAPMLPHTLFHNWLWVQIGIAHYHLGQHEAALDNLRRALALAERNRDLIPECYAHLGLGNVHRWRGQHHTALVHYSRALGISRSTVSPYEEVLACDGIALSYLQNVRIADARRYWETAFAIASDLGIPEALPIADRLGAVDPNFTAEQAVRSAASRSAEFRAVAYSIRSDISPFGVATSSPLVFTEVDPEAS